ncbi:MAG: putative acetyltransferase [Brachybacterium tyrofermentans]|uniref:putative acetyltransferase n=1 Tax=Brachybacterium tyrofermentans TaxID=47848 RepID=UPI003FB9D01F
MTGHDEHPSDPPDDPGAAPDPEPRVRAGWAPFLQVGTRVVLRYAIDREASPHGESMSDALGTILDVDEASIQVMTRRGERRVPRALVIAAKEVPPPPVRRPRAAPGSGTGSGSGSGSESGHESP